MDDLLADRLSQKHMLNWLADDCLKQATLENGYMIENPLGSDIWTDSPLAKLQEVRRIFDQRAHGAESSADRLPVRKATGAQSNFALRETLRRFPGHQEHAILQCHDPRSKQPLTGTACSTVFDRFQIQLTLAGSTFVSYNAAADGMILKKFHRCKHGKTGCEHTLVQGFKLSKKPVPNTPAFQPTAAASPAEPAPAKFVLSLAKQELPDGITVQLFKKPLPAVEPAPAGFDPALAEQHLTLPVNYLTKKLKTAAKAADIENFEPAELPAQSPIKEKEAIISYYSGNSCREV